jgi:Transglycosylase SLT domain
MLHEMIDGARRARVGVAACIAAVLAAAPFAAASAKDEAAACLGLIKSAEKSQAIPEGLLKAIGFTESGRVIADGRRVPWPWTVNAEGQGYYFETKQDAIAFVQDLQARGVSVIDVGCMQVNLYYHPKAFASLDAAFDPATNVAYAAKFLNELKSETADWGLATQYYHSRNPYLGQRYAGRVTLNGSGKVISNIGPIKPLSPEEKAALGEEVPDHLAAADELIAKARAARQPRTKPTAVEQAEATIEADFAPAAGANEPLRDIAASADPLVADQSSPSVTRGNNR